MELSVEQKRQLYHDGFLRLRQAVPQHLVREARRQININRSGGDNMEAAQSAVAAMFNESDIKPLLESGFGTEVPLQKGGQMAVLNPSPVTDSVSESGYPLSDIPYFQWQGHLDGLWNGSKGSWAGRASARARQWLIARRRACWASAMEADVYSSMVCML